MAEYADVIIDIVHKAVDRTFQYRIPEALRESLTVGACVRVPFGKGNTLRDGYVIGFSDTPEFDPARIKEIDSVWEENLPIEGQLVRLAAWLKEYYGSTMIQALKTVLPMKQRMKPVEKRYLVRTAEPEAVEEALELYKRKKQKARIRFLEALLNDRVLPYEMVVQKLRVTKASFQLFLDQGLCRIETEVQDRNPIHGMKLEQKKIRLTDEQQAAVDGLIRVWEGDRRPSLLYGVTGSGKTEVYMELIRHVQAEGKQAIVLIPEIALTWQTVMRFYREFGDRVSVIHSRMSAGEKSDQIARARAGKLDIMIGPRSALFTPFPDLGLVIIDEEHEPAYKSETAPRYRAEETAVERCRLSGGMVVLGSATPLASTYYKAQNGIYHLFEMKTRAKENSSLPTVEVVDLREELKAGNRSIFSRKLTERIEETLARKEQVLLFLNRRGYSGFVSCRSCGEAIKCPHCDVSLKAHRDGKLHCHYCGHTEPIPKTCPSCGSRYIAGFGTGTQKVEQLVTERFPEARVLRMDMDTTSRKGSHDAILSAFADGKADILVGTQMIVKGHDFPRVTLVGILAADLSLYAGGYESGERTFELLTQAAGRAGRDRFPGNVVIQSYAPDHYSIEAAASQDYEGFYWHEILYRQLLHYPPLCHMLSILISAENEAAAKNAAEAVGKLAEGAGGELEIIGPAPAAVSKIKDSYRFQITLKSPEEEPLLDIKRRIETAGWDRQLLFQMDMQ